MVYQLFHHSFTFKSISFVLQRSPRNLSGRLEGSTNNNSNLLFTSSSLSSPCCRCSQRKQRLLLLNSLSSLSESRYRFTLLWLPWSCCVVCLFLALPTSMPITDSLIVPLDLHQSATSIPGPATLKSVPVGIEWRNTQAKARTLHYTKSFPLTNSIFWYSVTFDQSQNLSKFDTWHLCQMLFCSLNFILCLFINPSIYSLSIVIFLWLSNSALPSDYYHSQLIDSFLFIGISEAS